MKTITILLKEYIELLELYRKISILITKIAEQNSAPPSQKGFDAWKYFGCITLKEDPLYIQKRIHDEWE